MHDLAPIYAAWDGNAEAMAVDIGEKGVTVRQWRSRGRIDQKYWPKIIAAAGRRGHQLPLSAFMPAGFEDAGGGDAGSAPAQAGATPPANSAERAVPNAAGVIREGCAGVELDALKVGEERQCLNEIHPNLVEAVDSLELNRDLIRPTPGIKFDAASQYTIRANNSEIGTDDEASVISGQLDHDEFLSVGDRTPTVTEDGGADNRSAAEDKPAFDRFAGRTVQCALCERRLSETTVRACQAPDCPHVDREAA